MELSLKATLAPPATENYAPFFLLLSSVLLVIFWIILANRRRIWLLAMVNLLNIAGIVSLILLNTDREGGKWLYMVFIPFHIVGFMMNMALNYKHFRYLCLVNSNSLNPTSVYARFRLTDNIPTVNVVPPMFGTSNSDISPGSYLFEELDPAEL